MTIIRWNAPTRLPGIFDDLFTRSMENFEKRNNDYSPAVNIIENGNSFQIQVAVPGYEKENIHVDLENNVLSIFCEKDVTEGQEINYTRQEFGFGAFRRSFTLPKIVDAEKISAEFKNGILHVSLPKRDEAKERLSRQIQVS
jgi:HSP20 family protein